MTEERPQAQKIKTYTKSSSFVLAALSGFVLFLVFSVLGFFLYIISTSDFIGEAKQAIESDVQQMHRWYDAEGINLVIDKIDQRQNRRSDQIYFLENKDGQKIIGMLDRWPEKTGDNLIQDDQGRFFDMVQYEIANDAIDQAWIRPGLLQADTYQIFSQSILFDDGHRLFVGRNLYDVERFRDLVGELSGFALVILAIIVIVNFVVSFYVVNRVNRISNAAKHIIDTGDLSQRIGVEGGWDDLSYLAQGFDNLMDYIESLVENIKQVSDNIAHDLRSPLTCLQNKIESIDAGRPMTLEEKNNLKADTETLLTMFSALLRISEIEAGKHIFERKDFDIQRLMEDIIEFFEPVAQDKNIIIESDIQACVFSIDRDLMFQALVNIMENAIKFTPENGTIAVTAACADPNRLEIIIADSGPGVPDEEKDKIFKRFYRAEASRTSPGHGLGLSMAKAIIDFHDGDMTLFDNNPGLVIKIDLVKM